MFYGKKKICEIQSLGRTLEYRGFLISKDPKLYRGERKEFPHGRGERKHRARNT